MACDDGLGSVTWSTSNWGIPTSLSTGMLFTRAGHFNNCCIFMKTKKKKNQKCKCKWQKWTKTYVIAWKHGSDKGSRRLDLVLEMMANIFKAFFFDLVPSKSIFNSQSMCVQSLSSPIKEIIMYLRLKTKLKLGLLISFVYEYWFRKNNATIHEVLRFKNRLRRRFI